MKHHAKCIIIILFIAAAAAIVIYRHHGICKRINNVKIQNRQQVPA
jgi:hypothetical protein